VPFPNLLATPRRRLLAFFSLYMAEGIPSGFTSTAVATQMRREGLDPATIGAFIAALTLPWAFKWAVGPIVDVVSSDRWGRRRTWIVLTQSAMVVALLAAARVDFASDLGLFTAILLALNIFSATQDVAIDALAVNVLTKEERGLANGLMFGGAFFGASIGGAGVLFLTPVVGFRNTFFFVAAVVAAITLLVAVPMRESPGPPRPDPDGSRLAAVGRSIRAFAADALRAFIGTRAALVAVCVAILPIGAYSLGLALQSNVAVELGLDDTSVGWLSLWSTILSAVFCVIGGWLSDRLGRRRMLSIFVAGMCMSTAVLALGMKRYGWIMPVDPTLPDRPVPAAELVTLFWAVVLVYSVFNGLMYGTSTALFMDVTTPRVAATQFTAYMAMTNLAIAYSANWQGRAATGWGYPVTLGLDALLGLACLAFLPFMGVIRRSYFTASIPPSIDPR
jgi:MFS family permease